MSARCVGSLCGGSKKRMAARRGDHQANPDTVGEGIRPNHDPRPVLRLGCGPGRAVRIRWISTGGDDRGELNHNQIAINILVALRGLLGGTACRPHGMDAGVATVGDTVRYPDGVVTSSPANGLSRLVPDPIVIFEVISPTSGHVDRIVKLREHAAVDSIRRYVIVESSSVGLTVHERQAVGQRWTVTSVMAGDLLSLPKIGIEISTAELYEGVEFPTSDTVAIPAK
jgi:Uma2 family endonuclease